MSVRLRRVCYAAAVVVSLPLLGLIAMSWFSRSAPTELGVREGRLAPCPESPNCVSSQAVRDDQRVEPIPFAGTVDAARTAITAAVERVAGGRVVESEGGYVRAEFTSRWLRFVDDTEFWFAADAQLIHVRSASRVGYSDLGANRRRVARLRDLLTAESERLQGP